MPGRFALLANLILLGLLGAFAWLEATHPNAFYRSVQEDQALEWASFWSFFIAGGVFAIAAWRQRRTTGAAWCSSTRTVPTEAATRAVGKSWATTSAATCSASLSTTEPSRERFARPDADNNYVWLDRRVEPRLALR